MIIWDDEAIILSSSSFSETSLILKVITKTKGIQKGLVKGAKAKKISSIFESGNLVKISYKARTEEMLGSFNVELIKPSYLIYLSDVLKFSGILSMLNLIEACLLENESEKELYNNSYALLDQILTTEFIWLEDYIKWEILLLKTIGFGLELSKCAVTQTSNNLQYISPKSGSAVSFDAGEKWKDKLFKLPMFFILEQKADKNDIIQGLNITTYFLKKFSNSVNKTLPFTRDNFIDNILNATF